MTCSNCESAATLVYQVTPSYSLHFCAQHLPSFLKKGKYAVAVKPYVEEVVKVSKKKATPVAPVVEEPVVEEPLVEDAPVTEPSVDEDGTD